MKTPGPKERTEGAVQRWPASARVPGAECLVLLPAAGPARSARSGLRVGSGGAVASWSVWRPLGSRHAPVVGTQPAESVGVPGGASAQRAREAGPFVESAELEVASPGGQTVEPGGFIQTWADALVPGVMTSVAENGEGGSRQTEHAIDTGQ